MARDPQTTIFIHRPYRASHSVREAYPKLLQTAQRDQYHHYAHMSPKLAAGSSHEAIVHYLGHGRELSPLQSVHPAMLRSVRSFAHHQRSYGNTIHLFGMLDSNSPFGSRRLLESLARELSSLGLHVQLHVGVWDPTPREFHLGLKELTTLQSPTITLASLFPVYEAIDARSGFANHYVAELKTSTGQNNNANNPVLPLHHPVIFSGAGILANDQFVIANHSLHGLDPLVLALEHEFGTAVAAIDEHFASMPDQHQANLTKFRHYLTVSARPSSYHAYFGTPQEHPYFEVHHLDNSVEAVEMMLSPHFGYHQQPYQTTLFLDEDRSLEIDRLTSLLVRQLKQRSGYYTCYIIEPDQLHDITRITNSPQELL